MTNISERRRKWKLENPEKVKIYRKKYQQKYNQNNRLKVAARNNLFRGIKSGKVLKKNYCEKCHVKNVRLEAHHYAGYSKENWFKVSWLCVPCHRGEDSCSGT